MIAVHPSQPTITNISDSQCSGVPRGRSLDLLPRNAFYTRLGAGVASRVCVALGLGDGYVLQD